ncbi:hypothetical protein DFP72DRAFT_1055518 [Ephemerocybe angulata]|uniref:Uncharacterized protein n=1 Tax=Ephemerocybe angulata TaxID=980116 RepID=A0A8H6H8Q8_9AGAR|nr:hypothetical protein DFP72DRAFT_1055518 [Tulosesus angulatus]
MPITRESLNKLRIQRYPKSDYVPTFWSQHPFRPRDSAKHYKAPPSNGLVRLSRDLIGAHAPGQSDIVSFPPGVATASQLELCCQSDGMYRHDIKPDALPHGYNNIRYYHNEYHPKNITNDDGTRSYADDAHYFAWVDEEGNIQAPGLPMHIGLFDFAEEDLFRSSKPVAATSNADQNAALLPTNNVSQDEAKDTLYNTVALAGVRSICNAFTNASFGMPGAVPTNPLTGFVPPGMPHLQPVATPTATYRYDPGLTTTTNSARGQTKYLQSNSRVGPRRVNAERRLDYKSKSGSKSKGRRTRDPSSGPSTDAAIPRQQRISSRPRARAQHRDGSDSPVSMGSSFAEEEMGPA